MARRLDKASPAPLPKEKARWFLQELLPTSAEFDQFCLDYFPLVKHRFSDNMDRLSRTNLLLELQTVQTVLAALHRHSADVFQDLEQKWPRRGVSDGQIRELIIGQYRLMHLLGQGAYGTVYAAIHLSNHQKRAVKILRWQLNQDEKCRRQFEREAELCGRIASVHAIKVLDSGIDCTGNPYLVTELLEGQTLSAYLSGSRSLDFPAVLDICRQIAHALEDAHRQGIIHRDQ